VAIVSLTHPIRLKRLTRVAWPARSVPIAARYRAFCSLERRGSNSFNSPEKCFAPSSWRLAFAYWAINMNRSCGSWGGAALLTALRYPQLRSCSTRRRDLLPSHRCGDDNGARERHPYEPKAGCAHLAPPSVTTNSIVTTYIVV